MPLPLFLGIGAAIAGAVGVGAGVKGAVNMSEANSTMKSAQSRHEDNIAKFERKNKETTLSMDSLGELELRIISGFAEFAEVLEKIHNQPEFAEINKSGVKLPSYSPEELKKTSVGAGVVLGGLGGAAAGTAGGIAAAGATTAAVMALGTASTGTAIASLSGAAATNAALAALGGGAVAAGGGGMALGSAILGGATLGVGLLVGGIIFGVTGGKLSEKADEAYSQMLRAERKIDKVCDYLNDLKSTADAYYQCLNHVNGVYLDYLNRMKNIVIVRRKTNWEDFTPTECLEVENCSCLVALLYHMCKVKLVLQSNSDDELNKINRAEIAENYNTTYEWYKSEADKGSVVGMEGLGDCYKNGYGVDVDIESARMYYLSASEKGSDYATTQIGLIEQESENYSEAVKWYRKAANRGYADAQNRLGLCYDHGEGVTQDKSVAFKWFMKAAEQGHMRAQRNVGICYYYGQGIQGDSAKSKEWMIKASKQGYAAAKELLMDWFGVSL